MPGGGRIDVAASAKKPGSFSTVISCATFVVMLDIPSLRQGASPDMLRAQMTAGG
jgi:hypothetical protein